LQQRFGITAVYVTHDQKEALAVSDRIVVMKMGQIAQIGTPSELYEQPASAFVADFIGDANLIEGTIQGGTFTAAHLSLPVAAPDGTTTATIRPERITLMPGGVATITSASYLGSRMEYVVQDEGIEFLVSRPISEARHTAGDTVDLQIDPADLILVQ